MSKCILTEPQKHALLQRFLAQWRRLPSRILCRAQITFGSYRIWQKVRSRSNSFHKIVFIGIVCTTVLRGASKQKWSVTYAYIRTFAYLQRWTTHSVTIAFGDNFTCAWHHIQQDGSPRYTELFCCLASPRYCYSRLSTEHSTTMRREDNVAKEPWAPGRYFLKQMK